MKAKNGELDRVGEILLAAGIVTALQIEAAVEQQRAGDTRPLGEILVALGHVPADAVQGALLRQRARRGEISRTEGLGLLDRAGDSARRAASCIDELTAAATELGGKTQ